MCLNLEEIMDRQNQIDNDEVAMIEPDWDDQTDIMPDKKELPDMAMSFLVFPHGHKRKAVRVE